MSFFDFEATTVETHKGRREALVLTPAQAYFAGQEKLTELRRSKDSQAMHQVDEEMISKVRQFKGVPAVIVFRQHNDNETCFWDMDDKLSLAETKEGVR